MRHERILIEKNEQGHQRETHVGRSWGVEIRIETNQSFRGRSDLLLTRMIEQRRTGISSDEKERERQRGRLGEKGGREKPREFARQSKKREREN